MSTRSRPSAVAAAAAVSTQRSSGEHTTHRTGASPCASQCASSDAPSANPCSCPAGVSGVSLRSARSGQFSPVPCHSPKDTVPAITTAVSLALANTRRAVAKCSCTYTQTHKHSHVRRAHAQGAAHTLVGPLLTLAVARNEHSSRGRDSHVGKCTGQLR